MSKVDADVVEAWRANMEHPRPNGVSYMADIQRMEDITETFEENFLRPYVHCVPRLVVGEYLPLSESPESEVCV